MTYSNYFPTYPQSYPQYPQITQPQMQAPAMTQNNNGIVWVQGEAGAKSYLVGSGNSVLLMDSEDSVFYIKSTDASGMPMPLRVFEYTERTVNHEEKQVSPQVDYITREEFEQRLKEISVPKQYDNKPKNLLDKQPMLNKGGRKNG